MDAPLSEITFIVGTDAVNGGYICLRRPIAEDWRRLPVLLRHPHCYVIWGLHVHPRHRGKGWGTELVQQAQAFATWCRHDLYLWVAPFGNRPNRTTRQLQALYRSLGFVWQRAKEDSWYYWAYDAQDPWLAESVRLVDRQTIKRAGVTPHAAAP